MPGKRELSETERRRGPSDTLVAVFREPQDAQDVWQRIASVGLECRRISVIGKGHHAGEQASGYYTVASGEPQYWGQHRSFWNNLWHELTGAAFLWVPRLGPVIIAGPMAPTIIAELHRAPHEAPLSVIGEAMVGLGVNPEAAAKYETAVIADHLLFLIELDHDEAARVFCEVDESRRIEAAPVRGRSVSGHLKRKSYPTTHTRSFFCRVSIQRCPRS